MVKCLSILSISASQEGRGHTKASVNSGKAENAQLFHDFPIESPLSQQDVNLSSEGQMADFSLELATTATNLLLLLPSFRLCCATIQFRALREGQRIQGVFITILIIFLAGLQCPLMHHSALSLPIAMALQMNKVKISSFISVKT